MKMHLIAPLNPSGCGSHGQYLVRELTKVEESEGDFEFYVQVLHDKVVHSVSPGCMDIVSKKLMTQKPMGSPDITVYVGPASGAGITRSTMHGSGMKVGFVVFETSRLSDRELEFCSSMDVLFTPNPMARDVLLNMTGVKDVFVVEEGTDFPCDRGRTPCSDMILNIGKFEKRKGHHALIEALSKTEHPTSLVAFWHNPWDPNGAQRELAKRGYTKKGTPWMVGAETWEQMYSTICLMPPVQWQTDLFPFMDEAQFAIFPHFGEAWGLPILDCIASGVPTFAPAHTGSMSYMESYSREASTLSPILTGFFPKTAYDGIFFSGDKGMWMEISPQDLRRTIEDVLSQDIWEDGWFIDELAPVSHHMACMYSWRHSTGLFLKQCKEIIL